MQTWTYSFAGLCMLALVLACDRSSTPPPASPAERPLPALRESVPIPSPVQKQGRYIPLPDAVDGQAYLQYVVLDVAPGDMPRAVEGNADTRRRKSDAETKAKIDATASLAGHDLNFVQRVGNDAQSLEQAALYVASKTQDGKLRAYAALMGRDLGSINQRLRELAVDRGADIPGDPDGQLSAKLDRLRQMSGAAMEQAFLQDFAVQAHRDMIALFEVQASQSQDTDLKAFAADKLPTLRKHYKRGLALQKKHAATIGKLNI